MRSQQCVQTEYILTLLHFVVIVVCIKTNLIDSSKKFLCFMTFPLIPFCVVRCVFSKYVVATTYYVMQEHKNDRREYCPQTIIKYILKICKFIKPKKTMDNFRPSSRFKNT